jgi:hypothetical protein
MHTVHAVVDEILRMPILPSSMAEFSLRRGTEQRTKGLAQYAHRVHRARVAQ